MGWLKLDQYDNLCGECALTKMHACDVSILTLVCLRDLAYVLMQAAMSLDTQRSCTVYLHTGGKQQDGIVQ